MAIYVGSELRGKQEVIINGGVAWVSAQVNAAGGNETISFKVYDASTGVTHEKSTTSAVITTGGAVGSFVSPLMIEMKDPDGDPNGGGGDPNGGGGGNLVFEPNADFSGMDLSGIDLSGKDLHNANFTGANLSQADLAGNNLENANFTNANLDAANFTNARLVGASFFTANLSNANLINVNIEKRHLQWSQFKRC